ncbi:hypothetical protein OVA24_09595 [Luteolibacter sp. SL250]|uniref:hypothetical protein n=1 Tax=Luteolibacter sp. SL250 TaxID=2995170 RepID=UPI00226D7E44|nr:hypothetical protein [Luteolibacter sp. SL250]WAC21637.1 hypothetical protein OVA24_09595 [Luteolibacter sp. SL250]
MNTNYRDLGKLTRTSMALDGLTIQLLEELSKYWDTSKAGVIRRAVQEAKERLDQKKAAPSPLEALAWLQGGGGVLREEAAGYRAELQAEREAKKYWWEA